MARWRPSSGHADERPFQILARSCAGLFVLSPIVAAAPSAIGRTSGSGSAPAAPSNLGYSLRLLRLSPVTARGDVVGALHAWQAPDDRHAASGNGIGRDNRLRQDDPPLIAARVRAGHQFGQICAAFTFQVAGPAIWISRQYPKSRVSLPASEISVSSRLPKWFRRPREYNLFITTERLT
jgi:hypothetical protein